LLFHSGFGAPTIGASAGPFALIAAFAMFYPARPLTVLLLVVPITMRARAFLLGSVALTLFFIFIPMWYLAGFAQLGGLLTGMVFARGAIHWYWKWPSFRSRTTRRELVTVRSQKEAPWSHAEERTGDNLSSDDFLSKEVDPILEKISTHGIQSLTDRERKVLETARQRISNRKRR